MRTLVFGDIHGRLIWEDILKKEKYTKKNKKIRKKEIKDSYTCDSTLEHMPSFIVAKKNRKIIFKIN